MRALWRSYSLRKGFAGVGAAVLFACAGLMLALHLTMARPHLTRMAQEGNTAFAAALGGELLRLLSEPRPDHETTAAIDEAAGAAAAGGARLAVGLYGLDGRRLYASERSEPARDEARSPGFLEAAKGSPASALVRRTIEGSVEGDVVATYLPVRDEEGHIAGVVRIAADVTVPMRRLSAELAAQLSVLAVAFTALYALLLGAVALGGRAVARKHREALRLAASVAQAEAAVRAKSEALAGMSHELRTPLNAIVGFAEVMKEGFMGPISPPVYGEYARDIHASGMHLLGVINDVLELARAEAGEERLSLEDIDLVKPLEEALRMVRSRAEQAGIALRVELARGLAPLRTDARKLRQIVINLLSNAVKFTPRGSVTLTLREVERGAAIEIAVRDTGIGIAAADIPRCLAPFGQVDTEQGRRHDGSGLGLPLSARLAQRLGGRLELESEPGKGTLARLTLPRGQPAAALPAAA